MNGMTLYAVFLTVPLTAVLGFGIPSQNVQIGTFKKTFIREQNVFRCMFGRSMLKENEELDKEAYNLAVMMMDNDVNPNEKPVDKTHGFNIKMLSDRDLEESYDEFAKKIINNWEQEEMVLNAYLNYKMPMETAAFGNFAQMMKDGVAETGCAMVRDAPKGMIAVVANYDSKVELKDIASHPLIKNRSECENLVDLITNAEENHDETGIENLIWW